MFNKSNDRVNLSKCCFNCVIIIFIVNDIIFDRKKLAIENVNSKGKIPQALYMRRRITIQLHSYQCPMPITLNIEILSRKIQYIRHVLHFNSIRFKRNNDVFAIFRIVVKNKNPTFFRNRMTKAGKVPRAVVIESTKVVAIRPAHQIRTMMSNGNG